MRMSVSLKYHMGGFLFQKRKIQTFNVGITPDVQVSCMSDVDSAIYGIFLFRFSAARGEFSI